jgi:hypothetical protein
VITNVLALLTLGIVPVYKIKLRAQLEILGNKSWEYF